MLEDCIAGNSGIGLALHRYSLSAAKLAIGGDEQLRSGVLYAKTQCFGRKPAEDERVDGTDSGNREGDDDALGNHGKIDDHPIAFDDAERGEGIGRLGDPSLQVCIGDHLAVTEFTLEIDGDAVTATGLDVPVDTVDGDVERAADEPFCRRDRQLRFARGIRPSGRRGR